RPRRATMPRRIPSSRLPLILLVLALALVRPAHGGTTPDDRAIYRIDLRRVADVTPLLSLGLDIAGKGPGESVDVILTPGERDRVRALGFEPMRIEIPSLMLGAGRSAALAPNLGDYHTVAEAAAEMASYASAHPSIARLDTIGFSLEGRAILALHVSDNAGVEEGEPEVLVVGCHHARELMSVEIPLYLMRRLLDGYGADAVITSLVNERSIWILPILNPDGHVYVAQNSGGQPSGWWRKNRRPNADGTFGVDLNRNYGDHWGWDNVGSSPTPASDVYRGTSPFSEPETAAFRDFVDAHEFTISASIHSYGELFLYPWGYATLDTPDHDVFDAIGDSVSAQNGYLSGNPKSGAIYLTNGALDDWAYGGTSSRPAIFGFTFEVNTAAQGGFGPPDALIPATCEENWGPLLTLLRYSDDPRRILRPRRPTTPWFVATSSGVDIRWSVATPDPHNPPVRHDVRRIASLTTGTDNAESGFAAWDTLGFSWSTARQTSGLRSFWSGAGNSRVSTLTSKSAVDAAPGESLIVMAWWDLEDDFDYWYLEASNDGGATWTRLPGNFTTVSNPTGKNEGNGVTGTSGEVFRRAAFTWGIMGGRQVLVRFRCVTDVANFGEGLYLDDLTPTAFESGIVDTDTQSPDERHGIAAPGTVAWFQVRGVDGEEQKGAWSARVRYEPGVSAVDPAPPAPARDRIASNAPNPFNPRTRIRYELAPGAPGRYRLAVHDASGRLVRVLEEGLDTGLGADRTVAWDGLDHAARPVGSGVYVVRLETDRGSTSRKITLLR
ncbi:MAG TPA: M14 family zinc carboxypeptidase, partial [Candidatus Eisenbacteria bacterium]|nr:M14 family zinc carboxypeptidase [Candidatus Eisenbacteria bacterium]